MLNIGCHLSISKGFKKAAEEAVEINANTFQFFTRNPRGGKAKDLDSEDLKALEEIMSKNNFATLFAHGAYTMNLSSNKEETRTFAREILNDDLKRVYQIPNALYLFHPGSHVKQGAETGIDFIVEALDEALKAMVEEDRIIDVCLEGMSGKGTEIGRNFDELKEIIERVKYNDTLGVCLDTCHLYSAGYDIVNDLDGVLEMFDQQIGLDKLKAIHLNDSKMPFASNKDRHEKIGEGTIGKEAIIRIINHPKLKNKIFNLETPNEIEGYKDEIEMLRGAFES